MYSGPEDGIVKIWDLRAPGCQREYESRGAVITVVLHPNQTELISGDQNGNIRVWDLTANSCSCDCLQVEHKQNFRVFKWNIKYRNYISKSGSRGVYIRRSLTVMWDGSMVVAANNRATCLLCMGEGFDS
ncbi:hypothetical protein RD792_008343 [Penstemon davidsonii]|uniref:Target of rapamycin complex subunit LST8 n=1 Tax=Penstemon davidsonii TaxID=160366 RepID=A0ABR0DA72_9LAMI|nr:hypothetical protein RD792_008343 [Penstemon davidsonii]